MKDSKIGKNVLRIIKALALPVFIFLIFCLLTQGRFNNKRVIVSFLRQAAVPTIICWGMMLVMNIGMLNFACGAAVLAATVLGGQMANMTNTGIIGLCLFTTLTGILLSALNGFLYNKMQVPSLVLSLGLMLVYECLPRVLFEEGVLISANITYLARSPYCFVIVFIMLVLFYILYNKTAFGHNLRAIGSNQAISVSVGLNIDRIKFMAYLSMGLFLGVAAVLYGSSQGEIKNVGALGSMNIMIDAFMGVFFARFLARYCNMAFAVLIANVIMKIISNGFVSMGMASTVRSITTGLFLLILLTISANEGIFKRRKADKQFAEEANRCYQTDSLN